MGLVELLDFGINKISVEKRINKAVKQIKEESGLVERDWYDFAEQTWGYPVEVQTVIDAKNDEQAAIFEKDVVDIEAIAAETKEYLDSYAPELKFGGVEFFETKNISLSTCRPVYSISANGKEGYDMSVLSNKLVQAYPYLYGASSDEDIHEQAQIIYNNFEDLYDESLKNLRIIQKGQVGEENVSRALARCKEKFTYLENIVIPAYEESGKTSETDVYIISSKGIFVCEVKNYGKSGETLHIYDEGMWPVTNDNGVVLSKKSNAFVQNMRHCNATKSFLREHLGIEVPIIPVLIIGNDNVDLDVHSNNIVIRPGDIDSMVARFDNAIDEETQKKIVKTFEEKQLDKNNFPANVNVDRAGYISCLFKEYLPYLKTNAKIANTCQELSKNTKKITYPIIAALIIITMIPWFAFGEWLAVIIGLIPWGLTLFFPGKLSGFLGLVSVVCASLWAATLIHPLAIISILSIALDFYMLKKNYGI